MITGLASLLLGRTLVGEFGVGDSSALRAAIGSGMYLALMALLAAGLTTLLRSAVAVLGLLVPFLLIVPFVFHDAASGIIDYLPDRAGQLLVQQNPPGPIVPWSALGVTALWAMAALLAGWFAINRRDA